MALSAPGAMSTVATWLLTLGFVTHHLFPWLVLANHDARRLYDDLLQKKKYNKLVRPVANHSAPVVVQLGLRFAQLIDVDEKNEIITTNMFVIQQWQDHTLQWTPSDYGGVDMLYVPSESLWLPDIVLYNNADGDYTVTLMTKATLFAEGKVQWEPPVIYKSYCNINVEYFPFDEQLCTLKFGSWTYDGYKVDLQHIWKKERYGEDSPSNITIDTGMDLDNFYPSQEWDVLTVPARKNIKKYPCCTEPYPDITFNITMRRKTLYYALNLIIPCVSINMLTLLVFYLPPDCGEKISICISLLLSLSIFQLLLMDLVPATSLTTPLLGKYILFTTVLVAVSVGCSVMILNMNHRTGSFTTMPQVVRWLFLGILPKLLIMHRPTEEELEEANEEHIDWSDAHSDLAAYANPYKRRFRLSMQVTRIPIAEPGTPGGSSHMLGFRSRNSRSHETGFAAHYRGSGYYPLNVYKAMDGVNFIAKHMKEDIEVQKVKDDWKYCALVADRLMMWIYTAVCFVGAMGILLNAPVLYDKRPAIIGK